jgi:hypothetical protein
MAAAAMIAVALIVPASVMAWTPPDVTPICAPNANHYEFTVNLATNTWDDTGYSYDWAFGAQQPSDSDSGWTTVDAKEGNNDLLTPRGDGKLWVRWTADHTSFASATPNGDLCTPPTQDPTPSPSVSTSPSARVTASPKSSPSGSVLAETGTPQITPPSTDALVASSDNTAGPGLRLLLLVAAGVLAAALIVTPSRRRSRA